MMEIRYISESNSDRPGIRSGRIADESIEQARTSENPTISPDLHAPVLDSRKRLKNHLREWKKSLRYSWFGRQLATAGLGVMLLGPISACINQGDDDTSVVSGDDDVMPDDDDSTLPDDDDSGTGDDDVVLDDDDSSTGDDDDVTPDDDDDSAEPVDLDNDGVPSTEDCDDSDPTVPGTDDFDGDSILDGCDTELSAVTLVGGDRLPPSPTNIPSVFSMGAAGDINGNGVIDIVYISNHPPSAVVQPGPNYNTITSTPIPTTSVTPPVNIIYATSAATLEYLDPSSLYPVLVGGISGYMDHVATLTICAGGPNCYVTTGFVMDLNSGNLISTWNSDSTNGLQIGGIAPAIGDVDGDGNLDIGTTTQSANNFLPGRIAWYSSIGMASSENTTPIWDAEEVITWDLVMEYLHDQAPAFDEATGWTYVQNGNMVMAFDDSGTLQWTYLFTTTLGGLNTPIINGDGTIMVRNDGYLLILNKTTGAVIYSNNSAIFGNPWNHHVLAADLVPEPPGDPMEREYLIPGSDNPGSDNMSVVSADLSTTHCTQANVDPNDTIFSFGAADLNGDGQMEILAGGLGTVHVLNGTTCQPVTWTAPIDVGLNPSNSSFPAPIRPGEVRSIVTFVETATVGPHTGEECLHVAAYAGSSGSPLGNANDAVVYIANTCAGTTVYPTATDIATCPTFQCDNQRTGVVE